MQNICKSHKYLLFAVFIPFFMQNEEGLADLFEQLCPASSRKETKRLINWCLIDILKCLHQRNLTVKQRYDQKLKLFKNLVFVYICSKRKDSQKYNWCQSSNTLCSIAKNYCRHLWIQWYHGVDKGSGSRSNETAPGKLLAGWRKSGGFSLRRYPM